MACDHSFRPSACVRVVRRCWHRWHVEREVRPSEERVGSSRADTCSDAKSCRSFGHQNREAESTGGKKEEGRRRRRSTPEALNLGLRGGSAPLAPPARAQVKCASGEVPPHLNRATNASAASERDLPILRYSLALLWGKKQVPWKEPQMSYGWQRSQPSKSRPPWLYARQVRSPRT